jgi:uroporphyrinogen decarboxylase
MNTLLLDALNCRNRGRAPVWLMRQAGRYMPQYREMRAKHSFLEMCHEPELIAEVTLQPIHAFGMDAAIVFSDILLIPEALDVGLHFDEGRGPVIDRPLNGGKDLERLPDANMQHSLSFLSDGIRLLRGQLDVPLIGFCGAPFTMASYMIEGKTSREFRKTKKWLLSDPHSFHQLLEMLTRHAIESLEMQIAAGVHAVQIFDSWANVLGYSQFRTFSLPYLQKIVDSIKPKAPVIIYSRGSSVFAADLAAISPNAISIDWNADLSGLRPAIPSSVALQGNLDPDILFAPQGVVCKEANLLLDAMDGDPGYIFNLGHGIAPDVDADAVKALIECVQSRK